jgi:hypothetical protein
MMKTSIFSASAFSMMTQPVSEDVFAAAKASMLNSPHGLSMPFLKNAPDFMAG